MLPEESEPRPAETAKHKLVQPLKWHGGKYYLAKRIIELMPRHIHYMEPFAGGLSVLLQKDSEGVSEVVNDLNGRLTNFWRVLQDPEQFKQFLRRVQAVPISQVEFRDALRGDSADPVEAAVQFFIQMRQSRQGIGKDFATLSRNRTRRGMNEQASSWLTAVDGLHDIHARLQRVVVFNEDALKIIKSQDGPNTLFYCDPPYLHETRSSTGEYEHEMTAEQHRQLLEVLFGIQGKFLLSGYHSELYDGWAKQHKWRCEEIEIDNKASSAKTKPRKVECIWMNFDSNN